MSGTSTTNSPSPSLDQIMHDIAALRDENAVIRSENASLASRFMRERLRWRVQTGLAVTVATGALLLSPDNRQAIAQGGLTLAQRVTALESRMAGVEGRVSDLEVTDQAHSRKINRLRNDLEAESSLRQAADNALVSRAIALETKTQYISVNGTTTRFTGTNVQILSGSGATNGVINGLGNLIVGYNENPNGHDRSGSHNLVVGAQHGFSSYGGLVAGGDNQITAPWACVSGGQQNLASGEYAAVSGGQYHTAAGFASSVSGGYHNAATGHYASVNGGNGNNAAGYLSTVSGGRTVLMSSTYGWAAGGNYWPDPGAGVFHSP